MVASFALKETAAKNGGFSPPFQFMWTTIGLTEQLSALQAMKEAPALVQRIFSDSFMVLNRECTQEHPLGLLRIRFQAQQPLPKSGWWAPSPLLPLLHLSEVFFPASWPCYYTKALSPVSAFLCISVCLCLQQKSQRWVLLLPFGHEQWRWGCTLDRV